MGIIDFDDNSTDNCAQISDAFIKLDRRIKYMMSDGKGVSAARNTGIERASGEYICFVDSDDWLKTNGLELLIDKINISNAQVVSSSYSKVYESNQNDNMDFIVAGSAINRDQFITSLFHSDIYQGYCWAKLFKSDIIKTYNIRFNTSLAYNEDRLFVVQYGMHIEKAVSIPEVTYCYRQHGRSAMNSIVSNSEIRNLNISHEILSANVLTEILGDKYPEAQAWLDYKLLLKACGWKLELKRKRENDMILQISQILSAKRGRVLKSKYISLRGKLGLLKQFIICELF